MKKTNPFIVAEISANHNGSLNQAKKLIDNAKMHGANAVKLQTYDESSMTVNSNKKKFVIKKGLWKNYTYWELYKKAKTPFTWHKELFDYAKQKKIICFSTPFDIEAVNFLEKLNCPIYKVASFEITDIPLIIRIAQTKKPIIISTGLSNLKEIELAYNTAVKYGSKDVSLLYCVSSYPAPLKDFNLNNILILKKKFKCRVGLSDHSRDNTVAVTAAALGADIFEKHIALKNQKKGLDIEFSLKGKELFNYVNDIKKAKELLGSRIFTRNQNEKQNLKYRRSLYIVKDIKKNEKLNLNNIKSLRPKIGLDPKNIFKILGKKSNANIKYGTPLTHKLLKKNFF